MRERMPYAKVARPINSELLLEVQKKSMDAFQFIKRTVNFLKGYDVKKLTNNMKKITICEDCKKRKAVIKYSDEPILALTHGWGVTNICRQCYIIRIGNRINQLKKNLKEQKKLIRRGK